MDHLSIECTIYEKILLPVSYVNVLFLFCFNIFIEVVD